MIRMNLLHYPRKRGNSKREDDFNRLIGRFEILEQEMAEIKARLRRIEWPREREINPPPGRPEYISTPC